MKIIPKTSRLQPLKKMPHPHPDTKTNAQVLNYLMTTGRLTRFVMGLLSIVMILGILYLGQSFLIPFVLAFILSYMFYPSIDALRKLKIPDFVSGVIIVFVVLNLILLLGTIFYGAFASIKAKIPEYAAMFNEMLGSLNNFLKTRYEITVFEQYIDLPVSNLFKQVSPNTWVKSINISVGTFINFVSKTFMVILFLSFILMGRNIFGKKILKFFQAERKNESQDILKNINEQVQSYLIIKTLISIVTGAVYGLACFILGIDFAIIWGFLAFLLNYIPTIGPVVATLPAIVLSFLLFSPWYAIFSSLILIAIQFISGAVIEPKLMADKLNLNIIFILLSLFAGGIIWGPMGMIISIPFIASINIVCSNVRALKRISILLSK